MKAGLFASVAIASSLAGVDARADQTTLHVTADHPGALLVQETPAGRVTICAPPCDAKVDSDGQYRFVGAPGTAVRKSQLFGLPNGPRIDLDVSTRSDIRYVEGWILVPIGLAAFVGGIALMVVAHDMNQQTPDSGNVYQDVGVTLGIIAGLLTIAWGASEIARNGHSRISASRSQEPMPSPPPAPPAPPPSQPPPGAAGALALPAPAFALQLFSLRF